MSDSIETAKELEGRYRNPDLDWESRLAHDAAKVIRELESDLASERAKRVEAEATIAQQTEQISKLTAELKASEDENEELRVDRHIRMWGKL